MKTLHTRVDIKPLSINLAYKGKLIKTADLRRYETALGFLLGRTTIKFTKHDRLLVKLTYGFSSRGSDLDNPQKPILDAISKKYGFNDNQIYDLRSIKKIVGKGFEYIEIYIKRL